MAKKTTMRDKLENLLEEAVKELSDDYRRKAAEAWDYTRLIDAKHAERLKIMTASHQEATELATHNYYTALSRIVNTGLVALKLDALPERAVLELVTLAHAAIPKTERGKHGVPTVLPELPIDNTCINLSAGDGAQLLGATAVDESPFPDNDTSQVCDVLAHLDDEQALTDDPECVSGANAAGSNGDVDCRLDFDRLEVPTRVADTITAYASPTHVEATDDEDSQKVSANVEEGTETAPDESGPAPVHGISE